MTLEGSWTELADGVAPLIPDFGASNMATPAIASTLDSSQSLAQSEQLAGIVPAPEQTAADITNKMISPIYVPGYGGTEQIVAGDIYYGGDGFGVSVRSWPPCLVCFDAIRDMSL